MARPTILGEDFIANAASATRLTKSISIPVGATHALVFLDYLVDNGSPASFSALIGTDAGVERHTPLDTFGWITRTWGFQLTVSGAQTLDVGCDAGTIAGPVHVVFFGTMNPSTPWGTPVVFGEESANLSDGVEVDPTTTDQRIVGHYCAWGNNGLLPAETITPGAGQTELRETQIDATAGAGYDTVASTSVEDGTGDAVTHSYTISETTAWATAVRHLIAVPVNGDTGSLAVPATGSEATAESGAPTILETPVVQVELRLRWPG